MSASLFVSLFACFFSCFIWMFLSFLLGVCLRAFCRSQALLLCLFLSYVLQLFQMLALGVALVVAYPSIPLVVSWLLGFDGLFGWAIFSWALYLALGQLRVRLGNVDLTSPNAYIFPLLFWVFLGGRLALLWVRHPVSPDLVLCGV